MKKVLFIIDSDPRVSHRPAEAIRIAAGVSSWKRANVTLYLAEAAVWALSGEVDELVDGDHFTRYGPLIAEAGCPIYVQRGSRHLNEISEAALPFQELGERQLGELAAGSDYLLHF